MSVITCPSCQSSAPPGAIFCDNCGYDLRTLATDEQQPVPPTQLATPSGGDEVVALPVSTATLLAQLFVRTAAHSCQPSSRPFHHRLSRQ